MKMMTGSTPRQMALIVLTGYMVIGFILMNLYPHQMTTDSLSYISIAQKYARGHFHDAINWVWSPLISWLLAPFVLMGIPPLYAIKIIGLMTGMAGFLACRQISQEFDIPDQIQTILFFALIPMFFAFTLTNPNPDFLVAVILLFYVRRVLAEDYGKSDKDGLCCGLLGALAYFAKAYAFPFFILHFTLMNLCRYYGAAEPALRNRIWRSFGSGMLTFMFVVSPWIYALYEKYDQLTFSTIGSYNFQLVNSEPGSSLLFSGFSAPTNPTAISAWEDPMRMAEGRWKPLDLPRTIQNTLSRICANALKTLETYQAGSLFSATIILFSMGGLLGLARRELLGHKVFLAVLTIIIHPSGYLPLLVDRRYLYLDILLILVLGAYWLNRYPFSMHQRKIAAIVILSLSFALTPVRDLRACLFMNQEVYDLSVALKEMGVGGHVGSNGNHDQSLFATYFISTNREAKYLGVSPPGVTKNQLAIDFKNYGIDYYLCWKDHPCHLDSGYPEIAGPGLKPLSVYRVK